MEETPQAKPAEVKHVKPVKVGIAGKGALLTALKEEVPLKLQKTPGVIQAAAEEAIAANLPEAKSVLEKEHPEEQK